MKFIILKFIFFCSTLTCFVSNPMSMGLLLLVNSFFISIYIGKIMISSWFCIVLVLVMIGGLLIIFMYVSSISSNESLGFNLIFLILMVFMFFLILDDFIIENNSFDYLDMLNYLNSCESFSLVKLYNLNCLVLTFFMIIYLIFCMIVVSSIVMHFKGPLRSFNYE